MALPNDPVVIAEAMDPAEVLDYVFDLSGMLETDEAIDSFALTMSPEGAALGVAIQAGARAPIRIEDGRAVQLWFGVAGDRQDHPAFGGNGTRVGIELRAVTNTLPPRTRERTFVLTVRQR